MQNTKEYTQEGLQKVAASLVLGPTIAKYRLYIGTAFAETTGAVHIVLDRSQAIFQDLANHYQLPLRFVCEETGDDITWLPESYE